MHEEVHRASTFHWCHRLFVGVVQSNQSTVAAACILSPRLVNVMHHIFVSQLQWDACRVARNTTYRVLHVLPFPSSFVLVCDRHHSGRHLAMGSYGKQFHKQQAQTTSNDPRLRQPNQQHTSKQRTRLTPTTKTKTR